MQLIQKIKKIYSGKLTYAANWDSFETIPFGMNGLHRIDAYFPLSTEETPIEVLNESWKSILKIEIIQQKIQQENPTEFGYRNLKLLRSLGPKLKLKSMMAQANGYEAYSRAFQNKTGLQADLHGNVC
jgi:hypothetical protein